MPVTFNIRHLELDSVQLEGELPLAELELEGIDELVQLDSDLAYEMEVERSGNGILVQGSLQLSLTCECARCLKKFPFELDLSDWSLGLALEGEDSVPVHNDVVDLTPYLREDILLSFPQHPLCDPECRGLQTTPPAGIMSDSGSGVEQSAVKASAWAALDKLKL